MLRHLIEDLRTKRLYFFDVLACLRADLLEKNCIDSLAVGFALFLANLPHVFEVELGADQEEDSLLVDVVLDLPHPEVQLLVALSLLDRVEEHNCGYSFIMRLDDTFECLLTHLSYP